MTELVYSYEVVCYNYPTLNKLFGFKMNRLNIKEKNISFRIYEGDLHQVNTEDGIGLYPISWVIAEIGEDAYIYPPHFLAKFIEVNAPENEDTTRFVSSQYLCEEFIKTIEEFGSINLDKWELCV